MHVWTTSEVLNGDGRRDQRKSLHYLTKLYQNGRPMDVAFSIYSILWPIKMGMKSRTPNHSLLVNT